MKVVQNVYVCSYIDTLRSVNEQRIASNVYSTGSQISSQVLIGNLYPPPSQLLFQGRHA